MYPYWHQQSDRLTPPTELSAEFIVSDLTFQVKAGILSIAEFSRVCGDVYRATTWEQLDAIADLYLADPAPGAVPSSLPRGAGPLEGYGFRSPVNLSSVMSGKQERIQRSGAYVVPVYEQLVKQNTVISIDFTEANFPIFACTLDVSLRQGELDIKLPYGMGLDMRLIGHPGSTGLMLGQIVPGCPRLILTGVVEGTDLRIRSV